MMGIGAQHQKDPNGLAWKQNRDFENLLKRLNAGNGQADEDEPGTKVDGFARATEEKAETQENSKKRKSRSSGGGGGAKRGFQKEFYLRSLIRLSIPSHNLTLLTTANLLLSCFNCWEDGVGVDAFSCAQ